MTLGHRQARLLQAVSSGTVLAVALVVALGVIPLVARSSVPDIEPQRAVPAFWFSVGLHLVVALILAVTASLSKRRSRLSTVAVIIAGVAALLLGFLLADAALAFREAGASMQAVAGLTFACVLADLAAGVTALAAAVLRPTTT